MRTNRHEHDHDHDHQNDRGHDHHHSNCCGDEELGMMKSETCCEDPHCGKTNSVSRNSHYEHEHEHDHHHKSSCCDNPHCGNEDKGDSHHDDHDHGHHHSSCCDDEECGNVKPKAAATKKCCDDSSHCKTGGGKQTSSYSSLAKDDTSVTQISIVVAEAIKCQFCDPSSNLPHELQVTRLRVANLCCVKEEQILRKTLEDFVGIEQVAVNLIGKYAIVKHCGADCCAPGVKMIEALNAKHLGVSLQSINGQRLQDEQKLPLAERLLSWLPIIHCGLITLLFIIALILSFIPTVDHAVAHWIFIASVILGIFPILRDALISLFIQKLIDIHCLMLIAVIGAMIGKEYFDASLVVALFLDATLLEHLAMEEVKKAVNISSARTLPKEAVLANGKTIAIDRLQIGDIIAVRAGEVVLCDGIITKGEGVIDESALTGESEPISKTVGSTAYGGTIVQNGYLEIQVNKSPTESLVHRLQDAVEEVQADRGHYATLVDQFAQYWTPFVLIVTMLIVVIGGGVTNGWWDFVHRGLVLLVLACPCAIVISAPIPSVCAISNGAKHGVLIRGSTIIEKMNFIDMIAVDKTGTLTKGFFTVNEKVYLGEESVSSKTEEAELISEAMLYAAALEQKSTHPLANAIVSDYCGCIGEMEEMMLALPQTKQLKILEGIGIEGWVQNPEDSHEWKPVVIGNERLFKPYGGKLSITKKQQQLIESYTSQHRQGNVILFILIEDELRVMISLSDTLRPETKDFIHYLREEMSLSVTMLTGDHPEVANKICQECNIPLESCYARLLPEEKLQFIQYSQSYYEKHPETSLLWSQLSQHGESVSEKNPIHRPDQSQQRSLSDENGAVELIIGDEENVLQQELITPQEQFESKFGDRLVNDPFAKQHHILMIGDGINDSTALAASTVGVAMGSGGTAMAVSAADVVLMTDNLLLVPYALSLSRYATRTIIENGVFAIAVKIVAVILAIIGILELWQAVLIDIGSLLVVIINGMKVLRYSNKYNRLTSTTS